MTLGANRLFVSLVDLTSLHIQRHRNTKKRTANQSVRHSYIVKIFAMIKDYFLLFVEGEEICEEFYTFEYPSLAENKTGIATSRECKDICDADKSKGLCYHNWNEDEKQCLIDYNIEHICRRDAPGWELTNSSCPFPFGPAIIMISLLVLFIGGIAYVFHTSKTIEE